MRWNSAPFLLAFSAKKKANNNTQLASFLKKNNSRQYILVVPENWKSSTAVLQAFSQRSDKTWEALFPTPVPVLLGKNGLAWGRGLHVIPTDAKNDKREGDRKTPAGIFSIGRIYSEEYPPAGNKMPWRKITLWDAWVDDPKNPFYNQHIVIDPQRGIPPWFESQKMRHGDPAYRWLIEIRHNSSPPIPYAGSAIFFHTRRGASRPTHGCTAMKRQHLLQLIQWLDSRAQPLYIILPKKAKLSHAISG